MVKLSKSIHENRISSRDVFFSRKGMNFQFVYHPFGYSFLFYYVFFVRLWLSRFQLPDVTNMIKHRTIDGSSVVMYISETILNMKRLAVFWLFLFSYQWFKDLVVYIVFYFPKNFLSMLMQSILRAHHLGLLLTLSMKFVMIVKNLLWC